MSEGRIQKSNEIVEVLEDGTVYYFDLNVCDKEAEKALDKLYKKQDKVQNFDFTASVFSLFVYTVHILNNSGWTTEDLIGEVIMHTDHEGPDDDRDDLDS